MFRIRGAEEADLLMMLEKPNWVKWMDALAVARAGKPDRAGRKSDVFEPRIDVFSFRPLLHGSHYTAASCRVGHFSL